MSFCLNHYFLRGLAFTLFLGICAHPSLLNAASQTRQEVIRLVSHPPLKTPQVNEKISDVQNKNRDALINDTLHTQSIENADRNRLRSLSRKRPVPLSRLFAALFGRDQDKRQSNN